jgi:hypothetical protein
LFAATQASPAQRVVALLAFTGDRLSGRARLDLFVDTGFTEKTRMEA